MAEKSSRLSIGDWLSGFGSLVAVVTIFQELGWLEATPFDISLVMGLNPVVRFFILVVVSVCIGAAAAVALDVVARWARGAQAAAPVLIALAWGMGVVAVASWLFGADQPQQAGFTVVVGFGAASALLGAHLRFAQGGVAKPEDRALLLLLTAPAVFVFYLAALLMPAA
ncbi:hypothetical protein [uncultured Albimonas sp.]|uniref:hypothetical protein n=1 Tax=uncultured Albimonas sp. TaxID=1331701 RepID=UPI0030EF804A|tara:strand:+ start:2744 stop:3250 length:507 start_codon:yes stop_codon:yes gene_type:complete